MYNSAAVLLKGIKTDFANRLSGSKQSAVRAFTYFSTSASDKEEYLFFDAVGKIKEWLGKMSSDEIKAFDYEIKNKDWYQRVQEERNKLSDARTILGGALEMQISSMSENWINFPDRMVNDLLTANGNAFDGTAFFATDRPNLKGDSAIDNLVTGTGTTLTQIKADLISARTKLLGYVDKSGNPFNANAQLVVYIPSHLLGSFEKLMKNGQTMTGNAGALEDNELQGTFSIVVNYFQPITNNDWYLVNTAASIPAFVYQVRQAPTWDIEDVKSDKNVYYFTTARSNAGYGNPTAICKVNN